jgi:hypothetical protein
VVRAILFSKRNPKWFAYVENGYVVDTPASLPDAVWYILLALGTFLATKFWDWWRKQQEDTREYRQEQRSKKAEYERQHDDQVVAALHESSLAMQQVSGAVQSVSATVSKVMEYLEEMSHRDATLQGFHMTLRAEMHGGIQRIEQELARIRERQEQIGSELLAYAMGRDPQRTTDRATLERELAEAQEQLERYRGIPADEVESRWNRHHDDFGGAS